MRIKKVKSTKKPAAKTAKSKKPVKTSKAKIVLARINVNIPKFLHNKTKQFALKNKITIQEIVSAAIKEYINKSVVPETTSGTETAV